MEATSSLTTARLRERFNNSFKTRLSKNLVRYVFVFRERYVRRVHHNPAAREHTKRSRMVLDTCETTVGSGSQLPSCAIARNEIVDAGIDDGVIEVQRPNVVVVGADRPNLKSNTMLHLDMPSIELGVMRA